MVSVYRIAARNGWYAQILLRGMARKLWIGPVNKTQASFVADHLERLKIAAETATQPPADSIRWARAVSPRIRIQLGKWGLIDFGAAAELPRTIGDYSAFYLAGRKDTKPTTIARWKNVRAKLLEHWPASASVASVTPGDCDRFAAAMRKRHKPSHAGKLIADAKQLFEAACRDRLIEENPLAGIDCSAPHDRARESYITPEAANELIAAADPFYAALIAIARFGGVRVPSEPLALRLVDVDWATGRISIPACKTPARVIPIFPELRPHLEKLWQLAPPGSVWLFDRARKSANTQWRKSIGDLITKTGQTPWPKRFQNLRASCQTDLEKQFPESVVNYWIGHDKQIGRKHYFRINDGHYAAALGMVAGMVTAPPTADTPRQSEPATSNENAGNA